MIDISRDWAFNGYSVYLTTDIHPQGKSLARPVEYVELTREQRGMVHTPTFVLEDNEVVELMQRLWDLGVRPKNQYTERNIVHIEQHLQDMRSIAFDALQIDVPKK
jgi:hypothetical protein